MVSWGVLLLSIPFCCSLFNLFYTLKIWWYFWNTNLTICAYLCWSYWTCFNPSYLPSFSLKGCCLYYFIGLECSCFPFPSPRIAYFILQTSAQSSFFKGKPTFASMSRSDLSTRKSYWIMYFSITVFPKSMVNFWFVHHGLPTIPGTLEFPHKHLLIELMCRGDIRWGILNGMAFELVLLKNKVEVNELGILQITKFNSFCWGI